MILEFADWQFDVDVDATILHTTKNAQDHCTCAYCRNYYQGVDVAHPRLRGFLDAFGINMAGPSELMPFLPTLMLACYRVQGSILQWGTAALQVDGVPVVPETAEDDSFFLWIGELELPWLQEEPVEDVISPANLPEFMERMQEVWQLRHAEKNVYS